jgi:tetratricopeptide (TPR) repeat protein
MDAWRKDASLCHIMRWIKSLLNIVLTAAWVSISLPLPAIAQDNARLTELLERLRTPDLPNWDLVEREIYQRWSISGSASADLLLERGLVAMRAEDYDAAYDHLTALTDHAPDFAEGWNARATLFFQLGQYGPSIADIQRVLVLNPDHFGALTGLGIMLEEMGEADAALAAIRAARAIHPHRPDLEDAEQRLERSLEGALL